MNIYTMIIVGNRDIVAYRWNGSKLVIHQPLGVSVLDTERTVWDSRPETESKRRLKEPLFREQEQAR